MSDSYSDNAFFEELARRASLDDERRTLSRLKSRIYSAVLKRQQESGPLKSLEDTQSGLCIFENLIAIAPVGDAAKCSNPCSVCHARILAEHFERAPIYWRNCPYVKFQDR